MDDRTTLTREQLYELVWQKPMSRLASEYSLSDVGLAKLCARHQIPTPPRGYWAMLRAGKAPPRARLPSGDDSSIQLHPSPPPTQEATEARDELAIAIATEKSQENRIVVPERLQAPCDLVQSAKAALQDAKADQLGILQRPKGCLNLRVSRAQLPRALRIADALLKACAARGWVRS